MIFVNGDSVSFGLEISTDDLEVIKEKRFSNIIAQKLDTNVINIAEKNISNDWIVRTSIDWLETHDKPDFALIQFGPAKRFEWYCDGNYKHISPSSARKKRIIHDNTITVVPPLLAAESYYTDIENDVYSQMNLWKNVYLMETYLKAKDIDHYFWHYKCQPYDRNRKYDDVDLTYKRNSSWKDMIEICDIIGNAIDHPENYPEKQSGILSFKYGMKKGTHPNENGHKLLAEHFLEHFICR